MYSHFGFDVAYSPHPTGRAEAYLSNTSFLRKGRVRRYCRDRMPKYQIDRCFLEYMISLGRADEIEAVPYRPTVANREASYFDLLKYDLGSVWYDEPAMDLAWDWVHQHYMGCGNAFVRDSYEECRAYLDMTKSPGYPWVLHYKTKKDIPDDLLREIWDRSVERLSLGELVSLYSAVCKTGEIRKMIKINQNLLRIFTAGSVESLLQCIRFFSNMNDILVQSYHYTYAWIGGTKYCGEWDALYRRLNKHPNAYAMDEKAFDATLRAPYMMRMADFRKKLLRHEDQTQANFAAINALYFDLIYTNIITHDGDIIQKPGGNPSGSFNTITDNTVILTSFFFYAWIKLCPDDMRQYAMFRQNVEIAICGDDNTWTTSDLVKSWFNAVTVARVWRDLGINAKYGVATAQKLTDLDFVSLQFYQHPELKTVVPRPNYQKMFASLAYGSPYPLSPKWSLYRAYSLRSDTFWNEELRDLIAGYISFIKRQYFVGLNVPKDGKVGPHLFSYEDIESIYFSDSRLAFVYLANEAYGDTIEEDERVKVRPLTFTDHAECAYLRMDFRGELLNSYSPIKNQAIMPHAKKKKKSKKAKNQAPRRVSMARRAPARRRGRRKVPAKQRGVGPFSAPLAIGSRTRASGLRVGNGKPFGVQESVVMSKREFIGTLVGSDEYNVQTYGLNPGNEALHPWFNSIAQHYDQWQLLGASLIFKPTVSADTNGQVMGAFIPDFTDEVPGDSAELQQYAGARVQNVWMPGFAVPVKHSAAMFLKKFFVVPATDIDPSVDAKMYYGGNVIIATEGCPDGQVVGSLFWEYKYRLINPVPVSGEVQYSGMWQTTENNADFKDLEPIATSNYELTDGTTSSVTFESPAIPSSNLLVEIAYQFSTIASGSLTWTPVVTGANLLTLSGFASTNVKATLSPRALGFMIIKPTGTEIKISGLTNNISAGAGGTLEVLRITLSPISSGLSSVHKMRNACRVAPSPNNRRLDTVLPLRKLVGIGKISTKKIKRNLRLKPSEMRVRLHASGGAMATVGVRREDKKNPKYVVRTNYDTDDNSDQPRRTYEPANAEEFKVLRTLESALSSDRGIPPNDYDIHGRIAAPTTLDDGDVSDGGSDVIVVSHSLGDDKTRVSVVPADEKKGAAPTPAGLPRSRGRSDAGGLSSTRAHIASLRKLLESMKNDQASEEMEDE